MLFGSDLSYAKGNYVETADGQKIFISNMAAKGLKFFGLPHIGVRERARIILNEIKKISPGKFLDAGCGIGLYSFSAYSKGFDILGVDIDEEKINIAKKIAEKKKASIKFQVEDLTRLRLKDEFDLIICSEVLEHINDDKKAMDNLAKALKNNGRLIITVPRLSKYSSYIKNSEKFGHVRLGYDENELKDVLEKKSLKIEKIIFYSSSFTRFALSLNEKLYKNYFLLGILFYPLYFLTFIKDKKEKYDGVLFVCKKIQ